MNMEWFSALFIPGMILLVVIGLLVVIKVVASRYKKIAPGTVGIFYGRKYTYVDPRDTAAGKVTRGFLVVPSGGKILMPIVESFQELNTNVFQFDIEEEKIPNKDNVQVNIRGVVTGKISSKIESLMNAAESFLGKTPEEINEILKNILMGHLRAIIGNMDIDDLLRKRDDFNKKVIDESTAELNRLGVEVTLVIKDVKDAEGYIDSLGKAAVAEAKRDANIKVAEAEKETAIKVSNAKKESAMVQSQNEAMVAEAVKNKEVKQAEYKVESETAVAKAEKAKDIALTDQDTILKVKQAERDKKEKTALIEVENEEAKRNEAALNATIVKAAEAGKKKLIIEAEANKEKLIIEAGAEKEKKIIDAAATTEANITLAKGDAAKITVAAQASKEKLTLEADGNKAKMIAEGEGKKSQMTAEAEGNKAKLLAEAEGNKAGLLATAEGDAAKIGQKLLAEAEGTEKLAEALKKMDENGKMIIILDKIPLVAPAIGTAGAQILEAIFKSVAAPLGSIDSLNILDMGGNGKALDNFSGTVPAIVTKVFASLKASGIDPTDLMKKIGINPAQLVGMLSKIKLGNEVSEISEEKKEK